MSYTWPSPLDDTEGLLALVGSFWSEVYAGRYLAGSLMLGRAQLDAQTQSDFQALLACLSRAKTPIYRTVLWYQLTLKESELNALNLAHWDSTYGFNTGLAYDTPVAAAGLFAWAAPSGLARLLVAANGIHHAGLIWTAGLDFFLARGALWFAQNPFDAPDMTIREVFDADGNAVDRECDLWLYRSAWDLGTVHTQYGYVLEAAGPPSSEAYRSFVNAGFDSLVAGTTGEALIRLAAATGDVPVAASGETVEAILIDADQTWVVTDKNAYGFALANTVVVSPGQVLAAGDPLVDAIEVFEFGRGGPVPAEIRALALGTGFLTAGYAGELVFENKVVPLIVEENVDGYTKVSFEVGGLPDDVEQFWDSTHTAGVAKGQTLAMLLDRRALANQTSQPTAMALPVTINPLGFLCDNCFRANLVVVRVRPAGFGPNPAGISRLRLLRKLVPPHTACIILVQLEFEEPAVIMDPDDPPGFMENVTSFLGMTVVDPVDEDFYAPEVVTAQTGGRCN